MHRLHTLVIFMFISVLCFSQRIEKGNCVDSVTVLQIRNKKLIPILDTILKHEICCGYYSPKLYFSIHDRIINDTISEFQIGAFGSILLDTSYYKGCFKYNNHWFFVTGQELNESVFIRTKKTKSFTFKKSSEIMNDGKLLLETFEDDSFSFWIYYYIEYNFILKEMYNPYCE